MSSELNPKSNRALFRLIAIVVIVVTSLIVLTVARITYPPVAVFLSRSNELKSFYGKCKEIQNGQTSEQVRAIMSQYQIQSETPKALVFNTPTLSADLCSVLFSDEPVPRVKSVAFELD